MGLRSRTWGIWNKAIIKQMHLDLHEAGKRAYNMDVTSDDIFIDMKFVIVAAVK